MAPAHEVFVGEPGLMLPGIKLQGCPVRAQGLGEGKGGGERGLCSSAPLSNQPPHCCRAIGRSPVSALTLLAIATGHSAAAAGAGDPHGGGQWEHGRPVHAAAGLLPVHYEAPTGL